MVTRACLAVRLRIGELERRPARRGVPVVHEVRRHVPRQRQALARAPRARRVHRRHLRQRVPAHGIAVAFRLRATRMRLMLASAARCLCFSGAAVSIGTLPRTQPLQRARYRRPPRTADAGHSGTASRERAHGTGQGNRLPCRAHREAPEVGLLGTAAGAHPELRVVGHPAALWQPARRGVRGQVDDGGSLEAPPSYVLRTCWRKAQMPEALVNDRHRCRFLGTAHQKQASLSFPQCDSIWKDAAEHADSRVKVGSSRMS